MLAGPHCSQAHRQHTRIHAQPNRPGAPACLLHLRIWGSLKRLLTGRMGTFLRSLRGYVLTVPERKEQSWQQVGCLFLF